MLHIPCVMSNYFLYENLSAGIVHFIPSKKLYEELYLRRKITFFDWTNSKKRNDNISCTEIFENCIWYDKNLEHLFVYFDSFEELSSLIKHTDYEKKKRAIKQWHKSHVQKTLSNWRKVFNLLLPPK